MPPKSREGTKLSLVSFKQSFQIMPGLTVAELRVDDRLCRYMEQRDRHGVATPEMWLSPDKREIELVGFGIFPIESIHYYKV